MKISYYELLGLIIQRKEPDLIKLMLNCGERYYQAVYFNEEFSHYGLRKNDDENENFKYYLADTLLESDMFDNNIEIIGQPKKIKKLDVDEFYDIDEIVYKIDEIIDYINEEEQNENKN